MESSICEIVEDGSVFDVSDAGADNVEELEGDSWVGAAAEGVGSGMLVGGWIGICASGLDRKLGGQNEMNNAL